MITERHAKGLVSIICYCVFITTPNLDLPVMDVNTTLKTTLDSLFDRLNVKSWTLHENHLQTTCTIRFLTANSTTRENSVCAPNTISYKQKSEYQINRDRQRIKNFSTERKTRSQTKNNNATETERCGQDISQSMDKLDTSNIDDFSSGSEVSDISSHLESPVTGKSLVELPVADVLPECAKSGLSVVEFPSLITKHPDLESHEHLTSNISNNKPGSVSKQSSSADLDRSYDDILYDHIAKRSGIRLADIVCNDCPVSLRTIGIKIGCFRMIYCEKCNLYICSSCRFGKGSLKYQTDQVFSHSSTCNNPASFVT